MKTTPVVMNAELADILLNNLFSNALRHTPEGGSVSTQLFEKTFEIANSASNGALDPEKLFKRFSKGGQSTDQYGLGLSIVQQIAGVSGNRVTYHFENRQHIFIVHFELPSSV